MTHTLREMADGGMYDHVGEGFHRYSTDERWFKPHFEKMLYDQATGTETWLDRVVQITDRQIELFYDDGVGGFYDTAGDQEYLLVRSKSFYGGARPTGNAIALTNLVELHETTGEARYHQLAESSFQYFGRALQRSPAGLTQFLTALKKRLESAS
jgi:uncharacterized protein YyaL (SSP411 family)